MTKKGGDPSLDELLEGLSSIHRRRLLVELVQRDPQDDAPFVVGSKDDQVSEHPAMMRHVHLPKLADSGFIEWDRESGEVTKGPAFDEIQPLLELLMEHEDDWS